MRRQGASIFIYLIFGILIVVFIINFRPGQKGNGDDSGCSTTSGSPIVVDGSRVNVTSYKVNFGAFNGPTLARTENALENLIRREILAGEGTDHGIRTSDDLVIDKIKQGYFYIAGHGDVLRDLFREDGTWDYNRYKNFVQQQFNVSLNSYQDEQRRELQAAMMAQEIADSARISRDEALSSWLYDNNVVTFDAVIFRPDAFKAAMKLTDEDVARWVAKHETEAKARYQMDIAQYKGRKPELKLREIFIAKADAKPAAPRQSPRPSEKPDKKDEKADKTEKKDDKTADKSDKKDGKAADKDKKDDKTAGAKADKNGADPRDGGDADRRRQGQARDRSHRGRSWQAVRRLRARPELHPRAPRQGR